MSDPELPGLRAIDLGLVGRRGPVSHPSNRASSPVDPGLTGRQAPEPLPSKLAAFRPAPGDQGRARRRGSAPHPSNHPSTAPAPGNRRLIMTLAVSLSLHAAAVIALLLLLHTGTPVEATVEKPTEVELVMEEHKGDLRPTATPSPPPPSPPASPAQRPPAQTLTEQTQTEHQADRSAAKTAPPPLAAPETPQAATVPAKAASPTQSTADTSTPAAAQQPTQATAQPAKPPTQSPSQAQVQEAERTPEPTAPAAEPVPIISLQGTDSPSDARAFGDRVIPAKPDAVFHNRPPAYPDEAAQQGQQGTVVVLIHVSPAGTAAGVDLIRSSGYVLLDRAAQEAVSRWRFLPAVKDGQPVASDMTMGFIFDDQR